MAQGNNILWALTQLDNNKYVRRIPWPSGRHLCADGHGEDMMIWADDMLGRMYQWYPHIYDLTHQDWIEAEPQVMELHPPGELLAA